MISGYFFSELYDRFSYNLHQLSKENLPNNIKIIYLVDIHLTLELMLRRLFSILDVPLNYRHSLGSITSKFIKIDGTEDVWLFLVETKLHSFLSSLDYNHLRFNRVIVSEVLDLNTLMSLHNFVKYLYSRFDLYKK